MSLERDVLDTTGKKATSFDELIKESNEKNAELLKRAERKRQLAQVLERGRTIDRLSVDLPPDLYGEWVPNDPTDILAYENMGFKIDTEYSTKRRLHALGDGKSVISDVIFMTCSMEDHLILDEIKRDRYNKANKKDAQKEEQELKARVAKETPEIPVIDQSKARLARKAQLEEAVAKKP